MLSLPNDRRTETKFYTHFRINLGMVSNLNKIELPTSEGNAPRGRGMQGEFEGVKTIKSSGNVMNC